jgi:hypothetical protein
MCEARFIHGLTDTDVERLFNQARDEDYGELAEDVRSAAKKLPARANDKARAALIPELDRLKRRLAELSEVDFFSSSGRESTYALLAALEGKVHPHADERVVAQEHLSLDEYRGRTWVTRRGLFVDRIASAWLIRRFIDPEPTFKWVNGKTYRKVDGELRFDMFEAEFTHVGDRCTFEVLMDRMGLADRALGPIAEIVHDIDIKDGKYGREQAAGVESLLAGIASTSKDDDERLERGSTVFEGLYEFYRRKRT